MLRNPPRTHTATWRVPEVVIRHEVVDRRNSKYGFVQHEEEDANKTPASFRLAGRDLIGSTTNEF